jgi:hypothetical protein
MANITLVIGESGTGKSTSIRNLDPKETVIINVLDKPLPFKSALENYKKKTSDQKGNYFSTDNYSKIISAINHISVNDLSIKNIIIDDFQYVMANEFMRRATERGFDKFTEIAQHAWQIIDSAAKARSDLFVFILSHSDEDNSGKIKCKTIGKMLDDKITIEGMFTTVLHSIVSDGGYKFLTQNDGSHIAKSPMGMFSQDFIDNDLYFVKQKMSEYYTGV